MENYIDIGAAVLSKDDIAGTDNVLASALETIPKSAVGDIMPVTKPRGPQSRWVEPNFEDDKFELLARQVDMDDSENLQRLAFSCRVFEDLKHMYTTEALVNMVQTWALRIKHNKQRKQLLDLINSPPIQNLPVTVNGPSVVNMNEDKIELLKTQIIQCIHILMKRFQFSDIEFSVIGPFESAFAVLELQTKMPGKIHFMGDDSLDHVYVFPTGTTGMSRAAFTVFDYADTFRRTVDSESGQEVWFFLNRSKVALNPIHDKLPIIEKISL